MEERILGLASRLGQTIAESTAAKALQAARQAVDGDKELQQVMRDYRLQADKLRQLEQETKPIEPEDKRALEAMNQKLAASEKFKALTAAQMEYIDLLRKVNEAVQKELATTEGSKKK
ncbi:MAG: YlbF family regulator [Planctomycetota bacterium]|nr:YlbF family regulator [Planctomycetota bacterium]